MSKKNEKKTIYQNNSQSLYVVELGKLNSKKDAQTLVEFLEARGFVAEIRTGDMKEGNSGFFVHSPPYPSYEVALAAVSFLEENFHLAAHIKRFDEQQK